MREGGKYEPLYRYLREQGRDVVELTFAEIETLLATTLPRSARRGRGWWSNRSRGAVQATAWMEAGYHVEALDLAAERVIFRKPDSVYEVRKEGDIILWDADLIRALRHYMRMTQKELAEELGVRQPTISEWETGAYTPRRSTSKLLTMVAEEAGFPYTA